jgi:hypothetical protein
MKTAAKRGFVATPMQTLFAHFDSTLVRVFASGGVHLNRRELLFGEAKPINTNTNERILSVRKVTS